MNNMFLRGNKIFTNTIKFILIALVALFSLKCTQIIPYLIDGEVELYKINDSICFDMTRNALLLDISNKEGLFLHIKDSVDELLIKKNKIYIKSNNQYFIYANDTIIEVLKEDIKDIDFKAMDY